MLAWGREQLRLRQGQAIAEKHRHGRTRVAVVKQKVLKSSKAPLAQMPTNDSDSHDDDDDDDDADDEDDDDDDGDGGQRQTADGAQAADR